jgi:hypothetical protein
MSELDLNEPTVPENTDVEPHARPMGAWADLASAVQEEADEIEPLEIDTAVPGLVVRFAYRNMKTMGRNGKQLAKIRDEALQAKLASLDTLIIACEEMCVRTPDGIQPLAPDGAPPIRFDLQLVDGLRRMPGLKIDLDPPADGGELGAREIAFRVFGSNDWAVYQAAQQVTQWMADARNAIARGAAGE